MDERERALVEEAYGRLQIWRDGCAEIHERAKESRKILLLQDPKQDAFTRSKRQDKKTIQLQTLKSTFNNCVADQMDNMPEALMLPETKEFEKTSFVLDGGKADQVYHFTYDWFESLGVIDDLDNIDGSHNGEDYFAYSFYIRNDGETELEYVAKLVVTGAAKSCDEAVRIMVYKNGEPTIYAKPKMGTFEPEPNTVAFLDGSTVFDNLRENFEPGAIDKYTVVIWFEGNDPECINDIMGGHMRLSMLFEAAGLEE